MPKSLVGDQESLKLQPCQSLDNTRKVCDKTSVGDELEEAWQEASKVFVQWFVDSRTQFNCRAEEPRGGGFTTQCRTFTLYHYVMTSDVSYDATWRQVIYISIKTTNKLAIKNIVSNLAKCIPVCN